MLALIVSFFALESLSAADFTVTSGATLSGDIVRANSNTVTIQVEGGGPQMIAREDIISVEIAVNDVGVVSGRLEDWSDGIYVVHDETRVMRIADGVLMQVDDVAPAEQQAALGGPQEPSPPVAPPQSVSLEQGLTLASGAPDSSTYMASVAIATLIKVNLLPRSGIDLDVRETEGPEENAAMLDSGQAAFAISALPLAGPPPEDLLSNDVRAVATLWEDADSSVELVARHDIPQDVVYEIVKVVFDNLPFLNSIDKRFTLTSLEEALPNTDLALHAGANRYYDEHGLLSSPGTGDGSSNGLSSPEAPAGPAPAGDQNFGNKVQM